MLRLRHSEYPELLEIIIHERALTDRVTPGLTFSNTGRLLFDWRSCRIELKLRQPPVNQTELTPSYSANREKGSEVMNWMPRETLCIEASSLRQHQEGIGFSTMATLWRRRGLIAVVVAISVAAAISFIFTLDRNFSSDAVIRLDFGSRPSIATHSMPGPALDPNALVESEARIINSLTTAGRVASRLQLEDDPAFARQEGTIARILSSLSLDATSASVDQQDLIAVQLLRHLSVRNDSRSYLITVSYMSNNPDKAATIANAFAEEYLQSLREASSESGRRMSQWFATQIAEKRAALALSERTIANHENLIDARVREAGLASLQSQAAIIRDQLKSLTENYENARAIAELKPTFAQVVMRAQPHHVPVGPNRKAILGMSVVSACGLSIAFVLLLERRDTGFRTSIEVTPATGAQCLGAIPETSETASLAQKVILSVALDEAAAAAGLEISTPPRKVVVVTSAVPKEGKSFLIRSLATSFIARGHRVLIVDTSPRADQILSDGALALEDIIDHSDARLRFFQEYQTGSIANVYRRAGLNANQRLISTDSFKEFLQDARQHYDFVLLEAPPVLLLTESWLLSQHADAVLLLARWNTTPRSMVTTALHHLNTRSVNVTGIILSRVVLRKYGRYLASDRISIFHKYSQFYKSIAERSIKSAS